MKTILAILLAMLIAISGSSAIDEETLLKNLTPDKESVATFIEDNFSLFVQKCNETSEDGNVWDATGVESKQIITVYTTDSVVEGLFLDFSEDDGYAILGDDYIMYDFQTEGTSPFIDLLPDQIIYSVYTGYGYYKDSQFHSINEIEKTDEDAFCATAGGSGYSYAFESNAYKQDIRYSNLKYGLDDIKIILSPKKYLDHIAFSKSYNIYRARSLSYISKSSCFALAAYDVNKSNGETTSDGNCVSVAIYNVLQYYAEKMYSDKMPSSESKSIFNSAISEPKTYNSIYDSYGNNISPKIKCGNAEKSKYVLKSETLEFPDLYIRVREKLDELYGSNKPSIEGLRWPYQIANALEKTASSYEVNIDADPYTLSYLYTSLIPELIESNNAYILLTSLSPVYGKHAMMGCGYAIYYKTTKVWRFQYTDYKFYYEVKNGWYTDLTLDISNSAFIPAWGLGDIYSDVYAGVIQLIFTYAL